MTSPESRDEAFRDALLKSAADDGPAPGTLDRELGRLGLTTVAAAAALTAASGATAKVGAASLFSTAVAKVAIVATIAVVGAAVYSATRDRLPAPVALAPMTTPPTTPPTTTAPTTRIPVEIPSGVAAPGVTPPVVAAPVEIPPGMPAPVVTPPGVAAPGVAAPGVAAPGVTPPIVPALDVATPRPARENANAPPVSAAAPAEERTRTLAAEVALIDRARTLARSAPGDSVAALDAYARAFPGGALRDEAAVVRVETLLVAGRRADAERTAQPYLQGRPNTPIARRMSDLLDPTKSPIP